MFLESLTNDVILPVVVRYFVVYFGGLVVSQSVSTTMHYGLHAIIKIIFAASSLHHSFLFDTQAHLSLSLSFSWIRIHFRALSCVISLAHTFWTHFYRSFKTYCIGSMSFVIAFSVTLSCSSRWCLDSCLLRLRLSQPSNKSEIIRVVLMSGSD